MGNHVVRNFIGHLPNPLEDNPLPQEETWWVFAPNSLLLIIYIQGHHSSRAEMT
jgi:hypothetical protein